MWQTTFDIKKNKIANKQLSKKKALMNMNNSRLNNKKQ